MTKPRLHNVICSTRPGKAGPAVAHWFNQRVSEQGKFEPVLVDLADFNLPVYDEPLHPIFASISMSTQNDGVPALHAHQRKGRLAADSWHWRENTMAAKESPVRL